MGTFCTIVSELSEYCTLNAVSIVRYVFFGNINFWLELIIVKLTTAPLITWSTAESESSDGVKQCFERIL